MKKIISCGLAAVMSIIAVLSAFPQSAAAQNPIAQNVYTSDPAPMVYNDTCYVYTGHDADGSTYFMPDWNSIIFSCGFEESTEGFAGRGAASADTNSSQAYAGNQSLYVSGRTSAWNGAQKSLSTSVFKPGTAYSFSADIMYTSGGASDTFCMKLQFKGTDGETHYDTIAEAKALKGDWVQLANTKYTIPVGASAMYIYFETADSTNSFYVDEVVAADEGTVIQGAGGTKTVVPGDVNCDGRINVLDLALAKDGIKNGFTNRSSALAADVDQSSVLENSDIKLLQQYIAGIITEFPVNKPPVPDNPWDDYVETASPEMLKFYSDSIYQLGNTSRLNEKIKKAQNGENVKLAYIGCSITEGGRTDTCYVSVASKYFADTFGTGNNVSFINAGLSGTSSVVGLMRCQNDILNAKPDVIFIEFSVNDHPGEIYEKGYESLVKRCLSESYNPAVVLIINRAKGGYSMQDQMAKIGKHYDLPIISMDNALTNAFNSGTLTKDDYYTDEYHPHEKGNALIADCIGYFYRQALKTENQSGEYIIPTTAAYGTEYSTASIVSLDSLKNFSNGSFVKSDKGYAVLPYTLKHNANGGNTPITFSTEGKGIFIVYSAKDDTAFGNLNVTVNGKTTVISGKKQYAWGGPEADLGYFQSESGVLDVSINVADASTEFTIWGIAVVK